MLLFDKSLAKPNKTLEYLRDLTDTNGLEREIATTLLASNLERIHDQGKAVSGNKIGEYKPSTKRIRTNPKGLSSRQVGFVDLFFTGKLQKELVVVPDGKNWAVGFLTSYGSELRKKQEEHFSKQIWGITNQDEQTISRIVSAFVSNPRSGFTF